MTVDYFYAPTLLLKECPNLGEAESKSSLAPF